LKQPNPERILARCGKIHGFVRHASFLNEFRSGFKAYIDAVEDAFGSDIDYAMLVKHYSNPSEATQAQKRYSPSQFISADKRSITGDPDIKNVSTS